MSAIDLRGFDYALEPLLRQRQWRLERLRAQLGRLQADIRAKEDAASILKRQLMAVGQEAARSPGKRFDPATQRQSLLWLAQLRTRIAQAEAELVDLHRERLQLNLQCLAQQQQIEAIGTHRVDCEAAFVVQETSQLAAEADRAWLARGTPLQSARNVSGDPS